MTYDPVITDALQQSLSQGQRIRLRISSASMSPIIEVGDMVVVESVAFKDTRLGDILVLRIPAGTLTHRLIAKNKQTCITKGDHLLAADAVKSALDILGRVVIIERKNGAEIQLTRLFWRWLNPVLGMISWMIDQLYSLWRLLRN